MAVAQHLAVAQAAGVIDARVVLAVADHVVTHANDGADDAEVALKAGGKRDDVALAQKLRHLPLKGKVQIQRAVEQAAAAAAGAVFVERLVRGGDDLRVRRQAEVVVRAEHDAPLPLHDDLGVLPRLQLAEIREQIPLAQLVHEAVLIAFCKDVHRASLCLKKLLSNIKY